MSDEAWVLSGILLILILGCSCTCTPFLSKRAATPSTSSLSPAPAITLERSPDEEVVPIRLKEISFGEDLKFLLVVAKDDQELNKYALVKESSLEYVPPNLPSDETIVLIQQRMHWIPNSDRPSHCYPPIITYQAGNQVRRVLYCEITILKLQNDAELKVGVSRNSIAETGHKNFYMRYSSIGELSNSGDVKVPFCKQFGVGDVVGVGLETHTGDIFFTLNGTRLTENINETSQPGMIEPTFPGVHNWFNVFANGACAFETNHGRHGDFKWTEATIQGWDASFEELQLAHNNETRSALQVNSERSGTGVQQRVISEGQDGNIVVCEEEDGTVDLVFVPHNESLEQIITLPLQNQEVESLPYYDRDVERAGLLCSAHLEDTLPTAMPTPNNPVASPGESPPPRGALNRG
jgi:hypothetical protein